METIILSMPVQWISYESNSTGIITTDTEVSYQNIWMCILKATGFFRIHNRMVRIAIILAIIGLVFIALYPKKNIKAPTRIFQKYRRRINSNIFFRYTVLKIKKKRDAFTELGCISLFLYLFAARVRIDTAHFHSLFCL